MATMNRQAALKELDDLRFAVNALTKLFSPGSFEAENARNAAANILKRISDLGETFSRLTEEKVAADVARALSPEQKKASGVISGAGGFGQVNLNKMHTQKAIDVKVAQAEFDRMKQDFLDKQKAQQADIDRLCGVPIKP